VLNRRCEPARVRRVGVLTLNTDFSVLLARPFCFYVFGREVGGRNDKRITVTM
jgi:hypothetical protein